MNLFLQISPEEAHEIMQSRPDCIVLDVREQYEFESGHVPGAVLMPYDRTEELAQELLPDKDQLILVYCRSGRRSMIAAHTLSEMGYTNVQELAASWIGRLKQSWNNRKTSKVMLEQHLKEKRDAPHMEKVVVHHA